MKSVNPDHERDFETWWHNEGSGLAPLPTEDREQHVRRVSKIAWMNGAYKATENCEHPARYGD